MVKYLHGLRSNTRLLNCYLIQLTHLHATMIKTTFSKINIRKKNVRQCIILY